MFQLGKTIVSEDILEKDFVCNLSACHGACCVDGDAGAPLSEAETKILEEIYPKVKPFLRKEGIEAIEKLGPIVTGKHCGDFTSVLHNRLRTLFPSHEYRKSDIAKTLIEHLEKWAKSRQADELWLGQTTGDKPQSIARFYSSLGYTVCGFNAMKEL